MLNRTLHNINKITIRLLNPSPYQTIIKRHMLSNSKSTMTLKEICLILNEFFTPNNKANLAISNNRPTSNKKVNIAIYNERLNDIFEECFNLVLITRRYHRHFSLIDKVTTDNKHAICHEIEGRPQDGTGSLLDRCYSAGHLINLDGLRFDDRINFQFRYKGSLTNVSGNPYLKDFTVTELVDYLKLTDFTLNQLVTYFQVNISSFIYHYHKFKHS